MRWFTSVVILFLCHVCIAQQGAEKLVLTVTPQHRANFRAFEQWFDSQESLQPYTQLLEAYRVAFNAATVNDGV